MDWYLEFLDSFPKIELPGVEAQNEMAGLGRPDSKKPENAKHASVLLCIFPDEDENLRMCFIKRSTRYPSDPHAGQISFPGGQREALDKSLWHTAIREAKEEVGLHPEKAKKIGALTDLYIPVSNFIVYPFLSFVSDVPNFRQQESEVDDIITPMVSDILDPNNLRFKTLEIRGRRKLANVPHFHLENQVIWGATAMILNEFKTAALRFAP
ncbi:MAG: NUDIX domain-containing protein [Bacteroidetes bacterium]|nr:NUDIX domain-containing protein [Bacteroidota bacterium]